MLTVTTRLVRLNVIAKMIFMETEKFVEVINACCLTKDITELSSVFLLVFPTNVARITCAGHNKHTKHRRFEGSFLLNIKILITSKTH